MPLYELLKDQGSLIAGLLAFAAGILVYRTGRAQVKAAKEQNADLRRIEKRRLARSSLIAIRLLDGVLSEVGDDINNEIEYVAHSTEVAAKGNGSNVDALLASGSRKRVRRLEVGMVWGQLGTLDPEWIKNYMSLDRELLNLSSKDKKSDPTINSMLNEYRVLLAKVENLRDALGNDARKVNDVLLKTQ